MTLFGKNHRSTIGTLFCVRNWGTRDSHGASKNFYSYCIKLLNSWKYCVQSVLCKLNLELQSFISATQIIRSC